MTKTQAIEYVNKLPMRCYDILKNSPLWDTPPAYKLYRFDSNLCYVTDDLLVITAGLLVDYVLLISSMMQEVSFPTFTVQEYGNIKKQVKEGTKELKYFGATPPLELKSQDLHMTTYHLLIHMLGCNNPDTFEKYYQELTQFYNWLFVSLVEGVVMDGKDDIEDTLQRLEKNPCL